MVFSNAGKNRVRDLVNTDLSYGQLGTSNTAEQYTDTALLSAIAATTYAVTTTTADKQIVVDYNLPSTAAVGSTITEYGIFNASSTLYARMVMASLVHTSTEQWQLTTRMFIN
jgi:hypothetical protein